MRVTLTGGLRPRSGKVAPLVAMCLVPIVGTAALVFDVGQLRDDRRRCVVAADAAALAAATDLYTNWNTNAGQDKSGTAVQSALTTAAANGFPNSGNSTVTVNVYPSNYQQGPFAGTQVPLGYAEVIITYNQSRSFSTIWGNQSLPVGARAVARGTYTPASPGILVLGSAQSNTFSLTSSGNLTVTNGGAIVIDSTNSNGASLTDSGNAVASTINLSGPGYNSSNSGVLQGTINYNVPPIPDPLAVLPEPAPPAFPAWPTINGVPMAQGQGYSTSQGLNYSGSQTIDLYPGYYAGINLSGAGSVVLHNNQDGSPGLYYISSQGLSISSSAGLAGSNVLLYSDGTGNINLTGSGSLTLSPPASGLYQGISIFQERSSTNPIGVTGSGNLNVLGTLYAAGANVTLTGQDSYNNNFGSQWIVNQLAVTGSGSFTVNYNGQATPIRSIQLVQ